MNDTEFKCLLNREAERFQDAYYEDWKHGRTVFQQIFMNESNPQMNQDLDYKISVMQAAKEGREIERKPRGGSWAYCLNPTWDWAFNDYRVKAREPRRVWITHFKNEALAPCTSSSRSAAETFLIHAGQGDASEFIELTPEIKQKLGL